MWKGKMGVPYIEKKNQVPSAIKSSTLEKKRDIMVSKNILIYFQDERGATPSILLEKNRSAFV